MSSKCGKYERMFVPGALKCPERLLKKEAFCAGSRTVVPETYIVEGGLTRVENQGSKPWCAAYSATTFGESVLWRKYGTPESIDPEKVYRHAKEIDGDPDGDGTSLNAALDGLLRFGYFDSSVCKVRTFGGGRYGVDADTAMRNVKAAIFRFGACVVGLDITTQWYSPKDGVIRHGGTPLGGHAVVAYSYSPDGIVIRNSWGDWGHGGDGFLTNALFSEQFIYGAVLSNALDGAK